jgi:hypothetical protein
MALSQDQKKHLLIGGGVGALAILIGSAFVGSRNAYGSSMHGPGQLHGSSEQPHQKHRERRRENDDQGNGGDNDRGEYGGKKKHHKGHRHGD